MATPVPDRPPGGPSPAFALLGTVQITLIFTITVISVPLPVIGREWGLRQSSLVLVSAAYGLSFSGLLLFGGRLTDRYGGRRMFTAGLVVFAAASMLAALAPGIAALTAARFAQGLGAALVAPAAVAVLRQVFPDPAGRGRAMATWGGMSVLGATLGTLLSGVVVTWLSWRWMLAVPLVVAAVAAVVTPRLLPADSQDGRATLDLPGALLAATGITLLSFGLVVTGDHAWTSAMVLVSLASGLVLLGAFVAVELHSADPLLPMPFLADPRRVTALLAIALSAAGTTVVSLLLVLYLQQIRDWTPLRTSMAFLPQGVTLVVVGRLSGRLIARWGAPRVTSAGLALAAGGLLLLAGLDPHTGYGLGLLPGLVLLPAGVALSFSAGSVLALSEVRPRQAGLAGGVLNTAMEMGPTVGLALLIALATARTTHLEDGGAGLPGATTSGYAWAFGAAGLAFAALAAVIAVTGRTGTSRPDPDPDPDPEGVNPMTARFTGKVALVTGGGTGIGQAVAQALAREGAAVVVAGRALSSLDETVKLIEDEGGHASAVTADVTRSTDLARLVAETTGRYGGLDIAVNNAGILAAVGPVGDVDEEQWHHLVAVNLTGTLLSMKHEIAHMRAHGGGVIVNIASNLGAHGRRTGIGAYVATKAAVSALTRNAALDHIREGIRINSVSPGPMNTEMSLLPQESPAERADRMAAQLPIGRVGTLDEVAAAVLYLASPDAGFAVGTDLVFDGGAVA
ncbi:glucose 1-dehydrogenase [Actinopolymorpha pittospori]